MKNLIQKIIRKIKHVFNRIFGRIKEEYVTCTPDENISSVNPDDGDDEITINLHDVTVAENVNTEYCIPIYDMPLETWNYVPNDEEDVTDESEISESHDEYDVDECLLNSAHDFMKSVSDDMYKRWTKTETFNFEEDYLHGNFEDDRIAYNTDDGDFLVPPNDYLTEWYQIVFYKPADLLPIYNLVKTDDGTDFKMVCSCDAKTRQEHINKLTVFCSPRFSRWESLVEFLNEHLIRCEYVIYQVYDPLIAA